MKDIEGFEGLYAITNDGRVWSYPKKSGTSPRIGYWMKPLPLVKTGYLRVCFTVNKKRNWRYIHRLVAIAYIPKVKGKNIVNHKDGDKTNNIHTNIEWANHADNLNHASATRLNKHPKLTKHEVDEIKRLYSNGGITQTQLALKFNTTQALVSRLIRGEAYLWQ